MTLSEITEELRRIRTDVFRIDQLLDHCKTEPDQPVLTEIGNAVELARYALSDAEDSIKTALNAHKKENTLC